MSSAKPQDGPATTFLADPKVTDIFTGQDGDYFGLVLIAGWPTDVPTAIEQPYQEFVQHVKQCFDENDSVARKNDILLPPSVYLYPSIHLHVTVATFAPSEKRKGENDKIPNYDYETFQTKYRVLVEKASKLSNWPKKPIHLQLQSAQLGAKAGILLWEDTSGTIHRMRDCLRQVASQDENTPIWGIPGIIHSTFLRYAQVPQTAGEVAQERFQSKVIPMVKKIFDKPIYATSAKLVCESTPYMHIPDDDNHTFLTLPLGTKTD